MDHDFSECVVLNARRAARAVSRRYDRWMREFDVTAAQFSLLAALSINQARSVTEVAELLAMDRTTASRNLDLLRRKGLVESHDAETGNKRLCALTAEGRARLGKMLPRWKQAQAAMRAELGARDFTATIETLRKIAAI